MKFSVKLMNKCANNIYKHIFYILCPYLMPFAIMQVLNTLSYDTDDMHQYHKKGLT